MSQVLNSRAVGRILNLQLPPAFKTTYLNIKNQNYTCGSDHSPQLEIANENLELQIEPH